MNFRGVKMTNLNQAINEVEALGIPVRGNVGYGRVNPGLVKTALGIAKGNVAVAVKAVTAWAEAKQSELAE